MMLLLVDVGNTNTVFALYEGREQLAQWRLATDRDRTSDQYAAALHQLMAMRGFSLTDVRDTLIASVVPQAVQPLRLLARDYLERRAVVVGKDVPIPIRNLLINPAEAGADRLVNALAAVARYKPPLVVVDFGTATTFDVVDAEGSFMGGAIAPGINLSLEALHQAAAQLPRIAVSRPERAVGRSTVEAMQSGVFFGYVGLIEELLRRIREELGEPVRVVATGGLARLFAKHCRSIETVDKDLTMIGLVEIHERRLASQGGVV